MYWKLLNWIGLYVQKQLIGKDLLQAYDSAVAVTSKEYHVRVAARLSSRMALLNQTIVGENVAQSRLQQMFDEMNSTRIFSCEELMDLGGVYQNNCIEFGPLKFWIVENKWQYFETHVPITSRDTLDLWLQIANASWKKL